MQVLSGFKRRVENLAFSPDGVRLATGGVQGPVEVWDTTTGERTHSLEFAALMGHDAIHFHTDGTLFLGGIGGLRRFDLNAGTSENCFLDQFPNFHFAIAPDGSFLIVPRGDTLVRVADGTGYPWKWQVPQHLHSAIGGTSFVGVAIPPDAKQFVTLEDYSGSPGLTAQFPELSPTVRHVAVITLRDCATGKLRETAAGPAVFAERPVVAPDGSLLVILGGRSLYIFRTDDLAECPKQVTNEAKRNFTGAAFHPSGQFLAAASNDASVRLIDTATWQETRSFTWKLGKMRSVCFSPDGLRLAAGAEKGQIVIWDVDL